ncbi:MAG: trypsin-like peptidase domain-containing protein [Patescibacteria group bacterium]
MERNPSLTLQLFFLAILIGTLLFLIQKNAVQTPPPNATATTTSQVSAGAIVTMATSTPPATTTSPAKVSSQTTAPAIKKTSPLSQNTPPAGAPTPPQATRIENPYTTPPLAPGDVNITARAALVNIFCFSNNGSLRPISGSGTVIDPRGIILTNAHVAQYVLLSQSPRFDLKCYVRSGSPAAVHWVPRVLYIPPVWVRAHVADINADRPLGTGEHDYALLSVATSVDLPAPAGALHAGGQAGGSPLPEFPSLTPDTREAIAFIDDTVLVASYPAEFAGASAAANLYPASTFTTVQQFLTFTTGSVDVISVGSVIQAQSGSSGGAIVNEWGRLVGVITTTSEGTTTAQRELRGITLSYIDRDLVAQTGAGLSAILSGDTKEKTDAFSTDQAPSLIQLFLKQLTK